MLIKKGDKMDFNITKLRADPELQRMNSIK
jgi:hypothetical protein